MKKNQIRCITSEFKTMENDVRDLINYNSTYVLGRTKDTTIEHREGSNVFSAKFTVNPNKLRILESCTRRREKS